MAKRRHHIIPLFSTRATATVSVALVLFVLGLASLIGIATHRVTDSIKEKMGFVILFNEEVTASDIASVKDLVKGNPGVASSVYTSPETVLDRWQKMLGEGEDIMRLGGVNPFVGELEVRVKPAYASTDSINLIVAPLMLMPQVREVKVHAELVDSINGTLRSVTFGLLVVAIALLVVSFVLIFNTVRLAVYAKRFSIYTMKLVGATAGFIRRPFLTSNLLNGFVAGLIASVGLIAVVYYSHMMELSVAEVLSWQAVIPVLAGVIVTGMLICLVAALFAANRYLRLSYDEMFK